MWSARRTPRATSSPFSPMRSPRAGIEVLRVDIGTRRPTVHVDIAASEVAGHHPEGAGAVLGGDDRGAAVAAMTEAFARFIETRDDIAGIVGIGGGGGTAIVTAGMRRLPLGLPKIMVSTLASGDVAPYVDVSDIVMMPSVTDMAGLNRLSRVDPVERRAGDRRHGEGPCPGRRRQAGARPHHVRRDHGLRHRDRRRACATTTTAWCSTRPAPAAAPWRSSPTAACLPASSTSPRPRSATCCSAACCRRREDRLGAIARTRLPYVGSVGALDMVNFWAPPTVPEKYRGRLLYKHNPNVTLMRTSPAECAEIGRWIAGKLNRLRRSRALPDPGKGRVGARHRGRRLLRSGCRRRAVRRDRGDAGADRAPPAGQAAAAHQRPAFAEAAVAAFHEISKG